MQVKSDAQLLRDYAEHGTDAAFRELVTRHASFVYSSALRQVETSDVAADITQGIFVDLARKAESMSQALLPEASLAGWLHRSTRFAALNHLRDTRRRRENERQAMEQLITNSEPAANWEQIRPALDEALDLLDDTDREAILLRYFKNQDLRTVGAQLGVSDDTAQKRVSRAVEKLREFFAKRGVSVGAGGLVVVISANAVQAAPVGLAVTISAAALAGTAATTSTLAATTKTIAMTTLQKTLVTATVAVLAGAGIHEARQAAQLRDQVQTLQQQQAPLAEQVQQLQSERDNATNQLVGLLEENSQLKSNPERTELLKLRGEIGMLRGHLADAKLGNGQIQQPPLTTAREYLSRSGLHNEKREYEAQLDDLNHAIELDPSLAQAYLERGDLWCTAFPEERGGIKQAIADFTRCLELKPNDGSVLSRRASFYKITGQYDKAIADLTTCPPRQRRRRLGRRVNPCTARNRPDRDNRKLASYEVAGIPPTMEFVLKGRWKPHELSTVAPRRDRHQRITRHFVSG